VGLGVRMGLDVLDVWMGLDVLDVRMGLDVLDVRMGLDVLDVRMGLDVLGVRMGLDVRSGPEACVKGTQRVCEAHWRVMRWGQQRVQPEPIEAARSPATLRVAGPRHSVRRAWWCLHGQVLPIIWISEANGAWIVGSTRPHVHC